MVPSTLRSFMVTRPPAALGSAVTPRCTQVSIPADWTVLTSAGLRRSTARCSTLAGNGSSGSRSSTATTRSTPGSSARAPTSRRPVERAAPVTRMQRPIRPPDPGTPGARRADDLHLVAGPGPQPVGGPALVDGHGQRPEGVLVQDHLAGRHRGERLGHHRPVGPAPGPHLHRVAGPHPGPLQVLAAQAEGEVAEVVDGHHPGQGPPLLDPGRLPLQPHQPARVQLRPQLPGIHPRGHVGGRRGEHVPPVEGPRHRLQPVGRVLEGDHPPDPAQRLGRPHQQPVVRPDQHLPAGLDRHHPPPVPTPGSTTARCTARGR